LPARRKLFVTRDNSRELDHYLPPGRFQYRESFREALNHFAPLSSIVLHFHYSCFLSSISLFKCCVISDPAIQSRLPPRNPLFPHSCALPRARASYKSLSLSPALNLVAASSHQGLLLIPRNRDFSLRTARALRRVTSGRRFFVLSILTRAPRRFTHRVGFACPSPLPPGRRPNMRSAWFSGFIYHVAASGAGIKLTVRVVVTIVECIA
jgi:hypothetical protein